jgi:hypothetical protein
MNIKHIIRKVLNENTNPIIKLLNKRGIDPINNIDDTLDFLENTLGLDSNEISDLYKIILGDNITEETYYTLFNYIFKPDEIYLDPQVSFDEEDNEICESILFVRDDEYENVMYLYLPGYFSDWTPEGKRLNELCPRLEIESEYKNTLNKIFGNTWKEPFKKWIHNQFGETVKTIQ